MSKSTAILLTALFCAASVIYADVGGGVIWERELSIGFNEIRGNTDNTQIAADLLLSRNERWIDEYTLKSETFYSSSDTGVNARRSYMLLRYAFSFGRGIKKPWYGFVKFEADSEPFSNVDARYVPGIGAGYWFYDLENLKLMAELGAGWEQTRGVLPPKETGSSVLTPRFQIETPLADNILFSQDVTGYSSLERPGGFRLRSETRLRNKLSELFSLKFSFYCDYTSRPPAGARNTDTNVISSLTYSF